MVIARFAIVKTSMFAIICLGCISPLYWDTLVSGPVYVLQNNEAISGYIVAGWVTSILAVPFFLVLLYRAILGPAVWLDGDSIIYLHKWFCNIDIGMVRSIDVMRNEKYRSIRLICVHMADGKIKRIGTGFLRESREDVLKKLNEIIFQRSSSPRQI